MPDNQHYDLFKELIYLYSAHRKYNFHRFSELGLTTGQPKVLSILYDNEGFVQKDLAARCMVEPATMTSLLARMERDGLIFRKAHNGQNGKRVQSVFLTEKGRQMAKTVREITGDSDMVALSELSDEEQEQFLTYMHKIRVSLEKKLETEETERRKRIWQQVAGTIVSLLMCFILTGTLCGCTKKWDSKDTAAYMAEDTDSPDADEDDSSGKVKQDDPGSGTSAASRDTGDKMPLEDDKEDDKEEEIMKLTPSYKKYDWSNPIFSQHFGADPYAMEYDGRLYIYMTADAFEKSADGKIKENSYGQIRSIYVVSTDDMINFTDHGEIKVAGGSGAAKWAHNSWAPAACWKEIDGEPKFFLYFADNGGGIGVLTADSPVGPFTDPLGEALISRKTPNCANVTWLFDPAVLVDDDGTGYLYFGGGVPEGKVQEPGTGRAVKLGKDMISLDGEPVVLDVPYLFEDSGIHKYKGRYYYTYCTNWSVDEAGTAKYGIHSGEIAMMESKSPLGPFEFKEVILKNPGTTFGLYGNNHHCVFSFLGEWYITYHARTLEKAMLIEKGYRSTHIDKVTIDSNGSIGNIKMTHKSRPQLKYVNPFETHPAVFGTIIAGGEIRPVDESAKKCGSGDMYLGAVDKGDFIEIQGVDFTGYNEEDAAGRAFSIEAAPGVEGAHFAFCLDDPENEPFCVIETDKGAEVKGGAFPEFKVYTGDILTEPEGVHDLFIVCTKGQENSLKGWTMQ
ncbi:MAG: family 43 glycosylhydrolase [Lachnospiraceae bacterium]|nr:family 43 glycosylhydrolase [Lachnospiraceae bacterium]